MSEAWHRLSHSVNVRELALGGLEDLLEAQFGATAPMQEDRTLGLLQLGIREVKRLHGVERGFKTRITRE